MEPLARDEAAARLAQLQAGLRDPRALPVIEGLSEPLRSWVLRLRHTQDVEDALTQLAESPGDPQEVLNALAGAGVHLQQVLASRPPLTYTPVATERASASATPLQEALADVLELVQSSVDALGTAVVDDANRARQAVMDFAGRLDAPSETVDAARTLKAQLRGVQRRQRAALPELFETAILPATAGLWELALTSPDPARLSVLSLHAALSEVGFSLGVAPDPNPLWRAVLDAAIAQGAPDAPAMPPAQRLELAERAADRLRAAALDAGDTAEALRLTRALAATAQGVERVWLGAALDEAVLAAGSAEASGALSAALPRLTPALATALEPRMTRAFTLALLHRRLEGADVALELLARGLLAQGDDARGRLLGRLMEARVAFAQVFGPASVARLERHLGLLRAAWGEAGLVESLRAFQQRLRART